MFSFIVGVSSHTKREGKSKTLAVAFILSVSYSKPGPFVCNGIILPRQNSSNSTHTTMVRAGSREGLEAGDSRGLPSAVQTASAELPTSAEDTREARWTWDAGCHRRTGAQGHAQTKPRAELQEGLTNPDGCV